MSDHQYKRLTKKHMGETAKAADMSLSADTKNLLYQGDRPVEDMELALRVGMDVAKSLGKKTVKDIYIQIAFDLIDHCRAPAGDGKKMSKKAIREKAHGLCVNVKGADKRVQVSTDAVNVLSTFDVGTADKVMDLAMEVMQSDGRSTIQDKDVRPLADSVGKCTSVEAAVEEAPVRKTRKKKKKAARRKGKK